jgi:H+/Cl- antiporter ClcA
MQRRRKGEPPKTRRTALWMNLMIPGVGQFFLGQRLLGVMFAVLSILCMLVFLGLFLFGMAQYYSLAVDGRLLEGDQLEQIRDALHLPWLIISFAGLLFLYLLSIIALAWAPEEPGTDPQSETERLN